MPASDNIKLTYGKDDHRRILEAVRDRYRFSRNYMHKRHEKWKKAEELHRAFVYETDEQAARRASRDAGDPQYTTINLPYSYALLLTAHTYWTSVFLARSPIFQYTARHGEPQQKVQALEAVIDYQRAVGQMTVPLTIWLLDVGKYGFGVVGSYWSYEESIIAEYVDEEPTFLGIPLVGKAPKQVRREHRVPGYQGNKLFNVRPHNFFPDPRVTLSQFHTGEFCGVMSKNVGWHTLLKRAATGEYFNLKALEKVSGNQGQWRDSSGDHLDREDVLPEDSNEIGTNVLGAKRSVDLLEMYVNLVPKDWKLADSKYPEIWVFTVAENEVVIGARPLGLYSNRFPFFILEYEVDGYAHSSRGMLEVTEDLNHAMSWLFNSRMTNIRAALNNMAIVDPSRVNMRDLENPGPGFMARLRPSAYGTDVRTAYTQLPVQDVTTGHVKDLQVIGEILQRVTGVTDNIMGAVNPGGRKTATEIRSSSTFGINRLKSSAEYYSAAGWDPLSQTMVQNTQQLFDQERQFKVAGELVRDVSFLNVNPNDIQGFYDFVPVDGSMPVDRFAQANLWKEILMGLTKIPAIGQGYDIAGIFAWMAQLSGLKNISQFRIQVRPDEQLLQQEQAGNVTPIRTPSTEPGRTPGAGNVGQAGPTG